MFDYNSPLANLNRPVTDELPRIIGDMGTIEEIDGGFKIAVHHTRAFPWDDVFKALLHRDFKVNLTRKKADIFIEAKP